MTRVADRGKVDEAGTIVEALLDAVGQFDGQARLAGAARPQQRKQPNVVAAQ